MALVVWVMMGIALWHFTVFLPDRFWGGIVGAFVAAFVASAIFGFIGLSISYFWGVRLDREHGSDHGHTREGSV